MRHLARLGRIFRSTQRSMYLLVLLIAATIDGRFLSRPRVGAEGAIWIHDWCRRIVQALGIECQTEGALPTGGVVVSNHMSYLDILLFSAITPFVMVAKKELRGWPLLGWLTAQAGTVYVERSEDVRPGSPRQGHAEVNAMMAAAYRTGLPVLFFPEGTTTDGTQCLPFRRGLFHSVLNGNVPLRVAALQFELGANNGTATVADDVCFVGDALFAPHIFGCLGLDQLKARVAFGREIVERDDRFVLSQSARAAVTELYETLPRATTATVEHRCETGMIQAL